MGTRFHGNGSLLAWYLSGVVVIAVAVVAILSRNHGFPPDPTNGRVQFALGGLLILSVVWLTLIAIYTRHLRFLTLHVPYSLVKRELLPAALESGAEVIEKGSLHIAPFKRVRAFVIRGDGYILYLRDFSDECELVIEGGPSDPLTLPPLVRLEQRILSGIAGTD